MYYQKKTLIIVPTTSLVHQLYSDFQDYGLDAAKYCHKVFVGQDKDSDRPITITTWQSIYNIKDKKWFQKYDVVIGDEAHLFKATSLTKIMTNLTNANYRFGFTGTLDGSQTHQLVLEGLFGPVHKVTTTAELIEQKHLSNFKIKAIVLDYPDELRKWASKNLKLYKDEIQYVVENNARNEFIKRLCLSLKGNTLVLYQFVEKQGKPLYKKISDSSKDRKVFFVHGGVEGKERDDIRYVVEQEQDAIIVASYGTFSTGVNIKNIHNIVFASPFKSKVKNLQSIGRGLRKGNTKDQAVLYDIVDDISWKSRKNHVLNHFHERVEIYDSEKFDYKIYTVKLGA
jgi:superfamily II DNA or RNA helicase